MMKKSCRRSGMQMIHVDLRMGIQQTKFPLLLRVPNTTRTAVVRGHFMSSVLYEFHLYTGSFNGNSKSHAKTIRQTEATF
jgi:hypothetical protein